MAPIRVRPPLKADRQCTGLLPILQALTSGTTDFDPDALPDAVIDHALACGLGPVLEYVSRARAGTSPNRIRIHGADLTAAVLTATKLEVVREILNGAAGIDCRVGLLKGTATGVRYYPSPHLRTTGDIDLLVAADRQAELEALLHRRGFLQRSHQPAAAFAGRHHSMPFWHPDRGVWIDVHTTVLPRQHPLANAALLASATIASRLVPVAMGAHTAYVMEHELQLVYTSARWLERFDPGRGIFPMLDAALLIRERGDALDWDRVLGKAGRSWAATALHVMLTYLQRWSLAQVPQPVLRRLAARDLHANWLSRGLLHWLLTRTAIRGRRHRGADIIWSALVEPASPYANLASVPYRLVRHPRFANRLRSSRSRRLRTSSGADLSATE